MNCYSIPTLYITMCVPLHWNMVKCLVDFPGCTSDLKKNNPPANTEDLRDVGSVPGLGRSPGGGNGNSLQYFCLENSMDKRAWQAIVYGVTESWTQFSD